jgi:hypothetical protein
MAFSTAPFLGLGFNGLHSSLYTLASFDSHLDENEKTRETFCRLSTGDKQQARQ